MEGVKNTVWIRILRLLYIAIKVYIKVSKYLDETVDEVRCFIQRARKVFFIKKFLVCTWRDNFLFIYSLSIFLTSTAFVSTNANKAYLFRDIPYFWKLSFGVTLYSPSVFDLAALNHSYFGITEWMILKIWIFT